MQTQQVIEPAIIDPEAIADFHRRRGTEELARQAVQLVQDTFSELQRITLQVVRDQEEDAEWLRLTVTARLAPTELRCAADAYLRRWVRETPPELRHLVVLQRRGA